MLALFSKEFSSYFNSLIAYIILALFMILTGLFMWVFPDTNVLDAGYAMMNSFFQIAPFVFLIIIPALTMRTFAEEFKTGTIELLFTKPLTKFDIIIAKFFAISLVASIMLLVSLVYYFSIRQLGSPKGNIDTAAVIGSYIGLYLVAIVFVAIGMLASSLTNNQVMAFILGVFLNFIFLWGISSFSKLFDGQLAVFVESLGLDFHYQSLSRGVIDSRSVIYCLSLVFLMLLGNNFILKRKQG